MSNSINISINTKPHQITLNQNKTEMTLNTRTVSTTSPSFAHNQQVPLNIWVVAHNLGKHPSVTVVDSAQEVVVGEIRYIDENTVELKFVGSFSGKAYFN